MTVIALCDKWPSKQRSNNKPHPKNRDIQIFLLKCCLFCWNLEFVNYVSCRNWAVRNPAGIRLDSPFFSLSMQSQKFVAGLHDCVTATFRNSGSGLVWGKEVIAWIRFMIGWRLLPFATNDQANNDQTTNHTPKIETSRYFCWNVVYFVEIWSLSITYPAETGLSETLLGSG